MDKILQCTFASLCVHLLPFILISFVCDRHLSDTGLNVEKHLILNLVGNKPWRDCNSGCAARLWWCITKRNGWHGRNGNERRWWCFWWIYRGEHRVVLFWLDVKEVGVIPHLQCSALQHQPISAQLRWKEAEPEADSSQGEFSVRHSERINERGKQLWLELQDSCQTAESLQFSSFSFLIFSTQLSV